MRRRTSPRQRRTRSARSIRRQSGDPTRRRAARARRGSGRVPRQRRRCIAAPRARTSSTPRSCSSRSKRSASSSQRSTTQRGHVRGSRASTATPRCQDAPCCSGRCRRRSARSPPVGARHSTRASARLAEVRAALPGAARRRGRHARRTASARLRRARRLRRRMRSGRPARCVAHRPHDRHRARRRARNRRRPRSRRLRPTSSCSGNPTSREVRERAPGGSSAMPHKQNSIAAVTARAAAAQAPGLVATLMSSCARVAAWCGELARGVAGADRPAAIHRRCGCAVAHRTRPRGRRRRDGASMWLHSPS